MINYKKILEQETNDLEMCKIQQKHFLHNLVCLKQDKAKIDRQGNFEYTKISPSTQEDCFSLTMKGLNKLNQSTIQFILFVLNQATIKNLNVEDRVLYLSPKEYRGYRNLKNQDSLRDKINQDIRTMVIMNLEFDDLKYRFDKRTGLTHSYNTKMYMNMFSSTSNYKKKIISIAFTPEFISYYRSLTCMNIPKELFSIDTRKNKNSVSILWHLANLKNMNKNKSNNGVVSVTNLLNHCSCIPSYDDIKEHGQIKQRIIDPFIRDLEALKSIEWHFVDEFNNVVDKSEIRNYLDFVNLKIHYDFNSPDEVKKV